MKNPTSVAQKWQRNLAGSTESMKAGIQAVTVNPMEKAAAAADRLVAGVQESVSSGRYAANCRKVTLPTWQNAMVTKGIPRVATGAQAAQGDMEAFYRELFPYQEQLKNQIDASNPRGDLNANLQRAMAFMTGMANFRRK